MQRSSNMHAKSMSSSIMDTPLEEVTQLQVASDTYNQSVYPDRNEAEAEAEDRKMTGLMTMQPTSTACRCLYILIFTLIGLNDGLILGYKSSLVAIFTEKKVPSEERALMSLIAGTYMLRIFFAPLADRYFSEWIGKRRSYLIPCKLFGFGAYYLGSFYIEDLVQNGQVIIIAAFFLVVGTVMILDANSITGLRMDYFGRKGSSSASASQTISTMLGVTLGLQVFTSLNSRFVCQEYFKLPDSVLTHAGFLRAMGYYNLGSLLLMLTIPEKPLHRISSLIQTITPIKTISAMYRTKPLWKAIVLNLFMPTLVMGMKVVVGQFYIKEGIRREHFILVALMMIPVGVVSNLIWIRLVKRGNLVFLMWLAILNGVVVECLHAVNYMMFDKAINYKRTLYSIIGIMCLDSLANWMMIQMTFFLATASKRYTVTYLSSITSMMATFRAPAIAVMGAVVDYVDMPVFFGVCLCIQISFNFYTYDTVREIDTFDPKQIGLTFEQELETKEKIDKLLDNDNQPL